VNTPQPEADTEYSRAQGPSRKGGKGFAGRLLGRAAGPGRGLTGGPRPDRLDLLSRALLLAAVTGAVILLLAEFTPLLHVQPATGSGPVLSVGTGSHDGWALIPIAALGVILAATFGRTRAPWALPAVGVLGVVALLLALIGDLPDAEASSQLLPVQGGYVLANAAPSTGLYLETLGAILLLLAGGGGLLLVLGGPRRPAPWRRGRRENSLSSR
jgi:hypothetical protein